MDYFWIYIAGCYLANSVIFGAYFTRAAFTRGAQEITEEDHDSIGRMILLSPITAPLLIGAVTGAVLVILSRKIISRKENKTHDADA